MNDSKTGFVSLFEDICQLYPDKIAVQEEHGQTITYAQLKKKSDDLAIYIRQAISKDHPVIALAVPKSINYLVSVIACWKAGAAFVPFDLKQPTDRLDYIFQDCQFDAVLVAAGDKPQLDGIPVLSCDDVPDSPEQPVIQTTPDDIAYIIYTSGSTGTPKGVVISHVGLCNVLLQQIKAFAIHEDAKVLFYLSTNFDASISDFGTCLLAGATLCIPQADGVSQLKNIHETLNHFKITHADLPPSILKFISPEKLDVIPETIVIGGEVCEAEIVREWAGRTHLVNVYGPTEATICTSLIVCDANNWSRPLIGQPLENVDYLLLDEQDQEIASGEGQLCIGGIQLAVGYLHLEEMNARKFFLHEGKRYYKTGDRVYKHTNGDWEFIGRYDRQIKLNGMLVAPEEIEKALQSINQQGRNAVVFENNTLIAYWENKSDKIIQSEAEIKYKLSKLLPSWMIPSEIRQIAHMPETATGKVDYRQLASVYALIEKENDKPVIMTETEEKLCGIWQSVLERPVTLDKSFMDLGGDSLKFVHLLMEYERADIPLTLDAMLHLPAIRDQAAWLDQNNISTSASMSVSVLQDYVAPYLSALKQISQEKPFKSDKAVKTIFMTGATGFLGSRLLAELLRDTDNHFILLVRDSDADQSYQRLSEIWDKYHISTGDQIRKRLTFVTGQLGKENFGLTDAEFHEIAGQINGIIHCAAVINNTLSFDDLVPANIFGTFQVCRLARSAGSVPVSYASTLSVFVASDKDKGVITEKNSLQEAENLYGGYAQTKWAAEYLLTASGLPCKIFRLGLVTGDTIHGNFPAHDQFHLFVKGLTHLGYVPQTVIADDIMADVTPVDYAASAMAALIRNETAGQIIYHIANRRGFSYGDIIRGLRRQGFSVQAEEFPQWQKHFDGISNKTSVSKFVTYFSLCRLFAPAQYERYRSQDLFQATGFDFNTDETFRQLQAVVPDAGKIPEASDALLDLYIRKCAA